MKYGVLGPLAVWQDGRELPLGGARRRALLALLLLHANELVPTARIVDELWAAEPVPATAVKTVQVYVSQLRKLLGERAISTRGPGYALELAEDALDANRFERLLAEGRRAAAGDAAAAAATLREALALWRGGALADLADAPFARGEIERLEQLRVSALELRLEADLALGRHREALPELEALARAHPLRESPRALLMLALYRAGRQADALAVYQDARRALVDELGLEPGQALQRLEKAILVQDGSLELAQPPPAPRARPAAPAPAATTTSALCPACGRPNTSAARFCAACGAALAVEQPIELRKTVTVLFCDVVASTELGERLDPESLRRLMSRYFAEAAAVLARLGGTVEKFVGDEVMAVFGVPAVRQDDALRAVRAAAELRVRIPALRVPEWDGRLAVRIGVNTGEVVAGDPSAGHGFVTGDAVNVGKRLEQAAQPGEIVLGEETHALVAHAVEAEPLEPLALKGKSAGVAAFRLLHVSPDAPAFPQHGDVPLAGRRAELDRLLGDYRDVVERGSTRLVSIVGEPGVGKSRLVRELVRRVEAEATVLVGRCAPYGETTFEPLRAVLPGLAAEATMPELFAAARRQLEERARERSVVLVLEDVHWAEPTLLDLVEYLSGALGASPVLLLCLARPDLGETRPDWLRERALLLEPLAAADAEELVEALGAPAHLRGLIAETAEGNPLFVEQLAAVAADAEEALVLPGSMRAVLAERLDRLGREERAVLERAAVVGRDFSLDAVVELSPPMLQAHAPARLLALARRQLLVADGADGFRFRHALIRDAAYEGMPKVLRAELHVQLAERLRERGADDASVGHHLEQAHRHRVALGRLDATTLELGRAAAALLRAAGRRACVHSDLPAALSLFERADALLAPDDPARVALLIDIGYTRTKSGAFAEAERDLDAAIAAARAAGDRRGELRAELERQFARSFLAPRAASAENARLADALLPELAELGDELSLATAYWLKSEAAVFACRWREREQALEQALAHAARAGDGLEQAGALAGLLTQALYFGPTPAGEAIRRCRELLAETGSDRALRASVSTTLAGLLAMQGEVDEARRTYADAVAVYEELGLRLRRASRSAIGAQIELLAGDAAAAERELVAGRATLVELGAPAVAATLGAVLADVLCTLGRHDEAEALAREVAATAPADDLAPQALWRSTLGRVLAGRDRVDEAAPLVREALTLTEGVEFPDLRVAALVAAAELAHVRARPEEERHLLREAAAIVEAKGNAVAAARLSGLLRDRVR